MTLYELIEAAQEAVSGREMDLVEAQRLLDLALERARDFEQTVEWVALGTWVDEPMLAVLRAEKVIDRNLADETTKRRAWLPEAAKRRPWPLRRGTP